MLKSNLNSKNILFLMTGSVACYKACQVLSRLKQEGHQIKVILSENSLSFIGKSTIEGLTGEAPLVSMYESGKAMDHINLARWADIIVAAPATANFINKIANGIGDDLLTTLFLAHDFSKPFLIAPAMNTKMYLHPVTQASINKLKLMGVEILETASGVLACGEIGSGRLLEPDLIQQEIESHLALTQDKKNIEAESPQKIKVLITAGGTTEPIDDVRVITNKSTGTTAAKIADALIDSGIEVTYLHSKNCVMPQLSCQKIVFETFKDLQNLLTTELKNNYAWVIHAAAVSDFSLAHNTSGKISSDTDELTLILKRNPKLINEIKKIAPASKLIGFKLTSRADENTINQKINSLFQMSQCDYVIQNDWQDVANGIAKYRIYKTAQSYKLADSSQSLHGYIFQSITNSKDNL